MKHKTKGCGSLLVTFVCYIAISKNRRRCENDNDNINEQQLLILEYSFSHDATF